MADPFRLDGCGRKMLFGGVRGKGNPGDCVVTRRQPS
jgi:hypothetical protein